MRISFVTGVFCRISSSDQDDGFWFAFDRFQDSYPLPRWRYRILFQWPLGGWGRVAWAGRNSSRLRQTAAKPTGERYVPRYRSMQVEGQGQLVPLLVAAGGGGLAATGSKASPAVNVSGRGFSDVATALATSGHSLVKGSGAFSSPPFVSVSSRNRFRNRVMNRHWKPKSRQLIAVH